MVVNPALHAEAASPATDPARLAAIAAEEPALGAVVAANPAAYDGLLDWLAQYGDAAARHAVAVRRGAATSPQPFATAAPRTPFSAGARRGLLLGGIGLAGLVAVAVGAVVLVNVLGGGSTASPIRVVEMLDEPRDDAWELLSPLADDVDDDARLGALVQSAGQNRALVSWLATDTDALTSLIDTRTGSILWTIDDFDSGVSLMAGVGVSPLIVQASSDDGDVYAAIDPGSGEVLSDTSGLDGPTLITEAASGGAVNRAGVLLLTDDEFGLYPVGELDEPIWTVDWDSSDGLPVLAGDRVIVGEDAYDYRTGDDVEWAGDGDLDYVGLYGRIYARDDEELTAVSESGEELWSTDLGGIGVYIDPERMVVYNEDDEELRAFDLNTGDELWAADAVFNDGYFYNGWGGDGILILPVGEQDEATVYSLTTGEEIASMDAPGSGSMGQYVLGGTSRVIYFVDNEDGDLIALDPREGDELWSIAGDDDLIFRVAGGQLVSVTHVNGDDAADDPVIRGLQP